VKDIAVIFCIAVAGALFLYWLIRTCYLRLRGKRTLGTVTGVRKDESSDSTVFYPIIKFTTDSGVTIEQESNVGTSGAKDFFHPGRQVEVLYSPTNPELFAIVGYDSEVILLIFLLLAIIGGVCYWGATQQ
jgi:hypothetical protein